MNQRRRFALLTAALTGLLACSSSTNVPPPFVFDNPAEVQQVCFDKTAGLADDEDAANKVVLPFECCTPAGCDLAPIKPTPHALVTQAIVGSVAAVDLVSAKVLDSERRIPGYTFVNVGGLPSAIVVPERMPSAGPTASESGPVWTYVSGRDLNAIRAIPTCRFFLGKPCGPELQGEQLTRNAFLDQSELPLIGTPEAMLLDPDGAALWVTLPREGLLARVALGTTENPLLGVQAPFALLEDGTFETPLYYPLDSGVAVGVVPPAPLVDPNSYEAVCGLGYSYEAAPAIKLPNAPHPEPGVEAEPHNMRLLQRTLADGSVRNLLFVADPRQTVLHALEIVGTGLRVRGALPVGAQLGDFAITEPVPTSAPDVNTLHGSDFAYPATIPGVDGVVPSDPPLDDQVQYLYGIDERGAVMAFGLSFANDGVTPTLQPLLAPLPRRDSIDMQANYADRLWLNPSGTQARALDVVDTRGRDKTVAHTNAYCGEPAPPGKPDELAGYKSTLNGLKNELKATKDEAERLILQTQIDRAQKQVDAATEWSKVPSNAFPTTLRGVFVVVASSAGLVSVIDVHDLDLQCRVRESCEAGKDDDELSVFTDSSNAAAVAVRRHAARIESYNLVNATVNGRDELQPGAALTCPDGYDKLDSDTDSVCVTKDPWNARSGTWTAIYEGAVTDVPQGVIELAGDNKVTLYGTVDFCKRGVLGPQEGVTQFQVAIGSPDKVTSDCPQVTGDTAQRLRVTAAYQDRLELEIIEGGDPDRIERTAEELVACYPRFVGTQVLMYGAYRVSNGPFLHRVTSADDGSCVVINDDTDLNYIDPLFTSRAELDTLFQDSAVAFTLTRPEGTSLADVNPTVTLANQTTALIRTNVNGNSGRTDSLPRRVRYFVETGELFIVDQASQGLKRFSLSPFAPENSSIR